MSYKTIDRCMLCKNKGLVPVIDLGNQYVVDFVKEAADASLKAPLALVKCVDCHLVQMKYVVNQDRLYKKFWYRSGINEQMRDELLAIKQYAEAVVKLKAGDKVLDIGCNDGTLLGWYDKSVTTVGIDPCAELVEEGLKNHRIDVGISDYFSAAVVKRIYGTAARSIKFKIITAVAMFYDVPDPVAFLKDCKDVLDEEGVLIVQMNYIGAMLADNAFDFICHEHQAIYSVSTLRCAVDLAGLELAGLEMSKSNGGSMRAYITHKGFDGFCADDNHNKLWLTTNVNMKLIDEMKKGLDKYETYAKFMSGVEFQMTRLKNCLTELRFQGNRIFACGASTRGTVLTQYLFRDGGAECIQGVADRDVHKHGLKMVGTWWDIMPEDLVRSKATHMLVLPWHFKESIVKREKEWLTCGGKLIFPLPVPIVVTASKSDELLTHTEGL